MRYLQPGASARDRLRRVESLAERTPGNIEGALAVARAALDAQEFAVARRVLTPLSIAPSQRVAMLMAELEEKEHGDEGRAREWMTRAVRAKPDPAWTADGFVSDRWMPVSPVTGRLDAFQWKDPIADLDADEALIEHRPRAAAAASRRPRRRCRPMFPSSSRWSRSRSTPRRSVRCRWRRRARACAHGNRGRADRAGRSADPCARRSRPGAAAATRAGTSPNSSSDSWRKLRGLFK